ncbi:MAG TPA: DUF1697 domain-containing protein [Trebonia sp.]|jgi:uncharacterized protein (DUF1697 family)|nr:DUF1697 domain-containing protein [Trebonia sp.]
MPNHIALLRGINLGGRNKIAMADLRSVMAELGHGDVATYIQSGNVVFTADEAARATAMADEISAAIAAKLSVIAPVIVLARRDLAQILAANPFPQESDPKKVHAVVLSQPASPDLTDRFHAAAAQSAAKGARDDLRTIGRTVYLHTPDGYGNSDLAQQLLRIVAAPKAGMTGTARNWATMTKLLALCDG